MKTQCCPYQQAQEAQTQMMSLLISNSTEIMLHAQNKKNKSKFNPFFISISRWENL